VPRATSIPGLIFRVEPEGLFDSARGSLALCRAIELARGLGCRSTTGILRLVGDQARLELASNLDPACPLSRERAARPTLDLDALAYLPASETAAFVSFAAGQGPAFWDGAFALADRLDRADPARAKLAPLRTRINLLATAAGAQLEAELWPHVQCVTSALLVNAQCADQSYRAVAILQLDEDAAASRVAADLLPRLASLARRDTWKSRPDPPGSTNVAGSTGLVTVQAPVRIGGQPLQFAALGRRVLVGWGDRALESMFQAADRPEHSVRHGIEEAYTGSSSQPPGRLLCVWPGRVRLPLKGLDGTTPLVQCLSQGPPIVWAGWNIGGQARDLISWCGLNGLVRRFLEAIPLASKPR
jgi:hypothetical protein